MSIKKTDSNKSKSVKVAKSAAIQLWYGENQSLLNVELTKWLQLFRVKYPSAQVLEFTYSEDDEVSIAAALHQVINSGSLFSQRVFIVVRGVLAAEASSELGKLIEQACLKPPADLVLLLVDSKKIAWSKSLAKNLKKASDNGHIVLKEFSNFSVLELERWIMARVKEQGGKIAAPAARQLAGALDNNFMALANEISKLTAWREGEEIRTADVDLLVTPKVDDDIFSFIDAVGKRDMRLAQEVLARQFSLGTSPQSIIGLLAWQVRVLALVRQSLDASDKRLGSRDLAESLGFHPYVITKALQQIPYYSAERIGWLYNELSDLDVKLKTTRTAPEVLFGLFLSKLSSLKPSN